MSTRARVHIVNVNLDTDRHVDSVGGGTAARALFRAELDTRTHVHTGEWCFQNVSFCLVDCCLSSEDDLIPKPDPTLFSPFRSRRRVERKEVARYLSQTHEHHETDA